MFTTWKTLERPTTLCVLPAVPPVSPITDQNNGRKIFYIVPSSFGRKRKKETKNIYIYVFPFPSVNDEFAYKMKECPPRIFLLGNVFLIFSPRSMHMHLPRSSHATKSPAPRIHQNF